MSSAEKQYQKELQLEQAVITSRLRSASLLGQASGFDPAKEEALRLARHKLREIERALDRLDNGEFGFCQRCEKPISTERLRAIPYADLCIECQSRQERSVIRPLRVGAVISAAPA